MLVEIAHIDLKFAALRVRDPRRVARLIGSLLVHGQQCPVLLVPGDSEHRYVLIDGYARVAALRRLVRDQVQAAVLAAPEAEALILAWTLVHSCRRSALEEAWLLRELTAQHGISQRELAARMSRSPAWVSRRLALLDALPESVQLAVGTGRIPPAAAMKYLAPLSRCNGAQCETLVAQLGNEPVSVRDIGHVYAGWRRAGPQERARIVAQPRLFLRAQQEADKPEPPDPEEVGATALTADLTALSAVARRARRRVEDGVLRRCEPAHRQTALAVFDEAQAGVALLAARIDQERRGDAGPGHP